MTLHNAPLRRVTYRETPSAVSTYPDVVEQYDCGHTEHHAPKRKAKARYCQQCARVGWCSECGAVKGAEHGPNCGGSNP